MSKKELEYQKIGDFYLPKVSVPAEDDKIENIGRYGLLRLEYLKEHKKGYYTFLMINGSVPFELRNVDSTANERVKKIIKQLADEENVNEELKAKDQTYERKPQNKQRDQKGFFKVRFKKLF